MKITSISAWKAFVLALSVLMFASGFYALFHWRLVADPAVAGRIEARFSDPDAVHRRSVLAVSSASSAALAGIQAGDVVTLDHINDLRRAKAIDERIGMTVHSGPTSKHVSISPTPKQELVQRPALMKARYFVSVLMGLMATIFGLLVGWRRADTAASRGFALAMLSIGGGIFFDTFPAVLPSELAFNFAEPILFACFFIALPYFALAGGQRPILQERPWAGKAFAGYLTGFVIFTIYFATYKSGALPPELWTWTFTFGMRRVIGIISVLASLIAFLWNWRTSRGVERERARWIFACMGLADSTYLFIFVNELLGRPVDNFNIEPIQAVVIFISNAGLCYALLRHRLFDLSFVVNRALVYTVISTMLLVVFSITEWAVDKLLHFHDRETNAVIDALVALGVILSFHRIQHWVGHRVDRTFYRQWHDAEAAFKLFMRKSIHISDPSNLQQAFITAAQFYTGAEGVAVYEAVDNGQRGFHRIVSSFAGSPSHLDADDPLVIDLRHARGAVRVNLSDFYGSALLAFPITFRDQLRLFIFIGKKVEGIEYRPDQIDLLATSAHQFGLSLESLRAEALERENATLRDQYRVKTLECSNAELRSQVLELKLAQQ